MNNIRTFYTADGVAEPLHSFVACWWRWRGSFQRLDWLNPTIQLDQSGIHWWSTCRILRNIGLISPPSECKFRWFSLCSIVSQKLVGMRNYITAEGWCKSRHIRKRAASCCRSPQARRWSSLCSRSKVWCRFCIWKEKNPLKPIDGHAHFPACPVARIRYWIGTQDCGLFLPNGPAMVIITLME